MKRPLAPRDEPAPIRKERNIQFSKFPPGQVPEASDYLARIERVKAEALVEKRAVGVAYDLREHSLQ